MAKLYGRIYLGDGKSKMVPVQFSKNHKPIPVANAFGYYLQFTEGGRQRQVSCDTTDAQVAFAAMRRKEAELLTAPPPGVTPITSLHVVSPAGKTLLADAVTKYFKNLVNRGVDERSIKVYRAAILPFIANCTKPYVEQIDKQDLLDHMGWLREQPVRKRKHGNPERTYSNKIGHLAIFLKAFGVSRLLIKSEYPQYEEKTVSAHTDEELQYLYSHADADQTFLLDFGLGTGFRDGEMAHAEYGDLLGNVLEVKRKPHLNWKPKKHHCRKVTIPQSLVTAIRLRQQRGGTLIFPNRKGKPDQHLLRSLQALVGDAAFHTECHKLRKSWATRLAVAGIPLHKLQMMLGHKSLVTTQRYLADVDVSGGKLNEAIEAATFYPKVAVG